MAGQQRVLMGLAVRPLSPGSLGGGPAEGSRGQPRKQRRFFFEKCFQPQVSLLTSKLDFKHQGMNSIREVCTSLFGWQEGYKGKSRLKPQWVSEAGCL